MSPVYDCTTESGRAEGVAKAVEAVRDGKVVVLPTDTVYGVGADAFSEDAVAAVLAAKGRGRDMPPPVLVPNVRTVDGLATDVPALGARPHQGVLARAADPGVPGAELADVGPRRDQRHGRAADAAGRDRPRAAERGRPDGGHQRQPVGPAAGHHDHRCRRPARRHRGRLPRRRHARRQRALDHRRLHGERPRILREGALSEADLATVLDAHFPPEPVVAQTGESTEAGESSQGEPTTQGEPIELPADPTPSAGEPHER